ncbi:hypothetical protein EON81_06540 [bacterium]|nr:MAG: hypothetical protein EON81_06540 [bacterium]
MRQKFLPEILGANSVKPFPSQIFFPPDKAIIVPRDPLSLPSIASASDALNALSGLSAGILDTALQERLRVKSVERSREIVSSWPLERMEGYITEGVKIGELDQADAVRAIEALRMFHDDGGESLLRPNIATNDWGHTIFMWMPGDNLAEFRVTKDEYQAMYDDGEDGSDFKSGNLKPVVDWLLEHAAFIRARYGMS